MVYLLLLKFTVNEYYRFVQFIFLTEMLQAESDIFLIFIILRTLEVLQLTGMIHRYPCWVEWINGLLHGPFHKIYFPLTINQYNSVSSGTISTFWNTDKHCAILLYNRRRQIIQSLLKLRIRKMALVPLQQ